MFNPAVIVGATLAIGFKAEYAYGSELLIVSLVGPYAGALTSPASLFALEPYLKAFPHKGLCTLYISSHKPTAGEAATAKVSVSAGIPALGEVGASIAASKDVEGQVKWSSSRFQTYWPGAGDQLVMFTQESKLRYWQIDVSDLKIKKRVGGSSNLQAPNIDLDLSLPLPGLNVRMPDIPVPGLNLRLPVPDICPAIDVPDVNVDRARPQKRDEKKLWNAFSYTAASLYWRRDKNDSNVRRDSNVIPQCGSGISFGHSVLLTSLSDILALIYDERTKRLSGKAVALKVFAALAESLHVDLDLFRMAMLGSSSEIRSAIVDLTSSEQLLSQSGETLPPEQAELLKQKKLPLLLESSFAIPVEKLNARGIKITGAASEVPRLDDVFFTKINSEFASSTPEVRKSYLQALRLRVRVRDLMTADGGFRAGFELFGQSLGITYKTIDRAGAEGTVDVATYWFQSLVNPNNANDVAYPYELGVPKVLLFDQ